MPNLLLFADMSGISKQLLSLYPVDWLIIGIYFVVVLGIGFYLKRFAGTGEDFFLAGRKMTAWVAGLSFISANLSALETMGWSASAYQYGMLAAHAYLIGAIPAILFLAVVMMPFYYICKTHSVPGYLKLRFDGRSSTLAGISFAFMMIMVSGASMFAMAKILHLLLGWNMDLSIWIASLTVAVYVTLGGLISAVFNEVLQFFLIWLGTMLIPILGLINAGGWDKMMETIQHNVKVIHPTLQNADFTCLWHNLGNFDNPMGINWFGLVFGWGIAVSFGYWCTDFLQVQRVIVAKNLRAAQNGTIIGSVLKMCVPLIVTIPGLLGLAVLMNSDHSLMILVPENDPRANITLHTYNDVLPLLMGKYLGPGLLGLGVTAMIAGFMSGMAGNVSAFATVWTYDVYKPLFNKNASDHHYLNMGRWASLLGVIFSIGTAYALFYFSNILEFLQVLLFFFIVPLFGVIILGMLWKRCTASGGFWGFFIAIMLSVVMWVFVHTFPDGYRPLPQLTLDKGAVVSLETETVPAAKDEKGVETPESRKIVKVTVESGMVEITNVPIELSSGRKPFLDGTMTIENAAVELPKTIAGKDKTNPVRVLAPDVVSAENKKPSQFGVEGVPVVLEPGVKVVAHDITQHFNAAQFNKAHNKIIALSEKAQPMAVNYYSAFWTLVTSMVIAVVVSLFTKPKSDKDLKDLVMGVTKIPDEGPCPWYEKPILWAVIVTIVLVAINIIFW